ncbi:MAG: carbohydrate transporter substrate-binding protein [Clostridia bacterium]|jgi:ABC-type glycerol-3-phosphate transport system substrate-binding protein|nr:carbohydrate transporter substrate-binding protein [Clostridia bacterium]
MKKVFLLAGTMLSLFIIIYLYILNLNSSYDSVIENNPPSVTLTVLAGQSTSDAGIQDMINDLLFKKYPEIKLEWECVDWGDQFNAVLKAKFASGDIPDIIIGKAQDVTTYYPSGNLAPMSEEQLNYFSDAALPSVKINEKAYGLPYNALYQGVIYNKAIFDKYHLAVPATQAELHHIVKSLKEVGVTPFASHFQDSWSVGNMTMQFAMNEVFNLYPFFGDDIRSGNRQFSSSLEFQSCIKLNKYILDYTWDDTWMVDQNAADTRFANGEAAMYLTGSWSLQTINAQKNDLRLGIFPFPNKSGNSKLIFEPNMTFMKSSKTPYPKEVDKVFKIIFEDDSLAKDITYFTQSIPLLENVDLNYLSMIETDTNYYKKHYLITDVTLGNTQLIWPFQQEYSKHIAEWLQGNTSFEDLLIYLDTHKSESSSPF